MSGPARASAMAWSTTRAVGSAHHTRCVVATCAALLSLVLCLPLTGGESRLSFDAADGRAASVVLGALLTLDPGLGDLHPDLLMADRGAVPVTLALTQSSTAGARQAMAHALGVWWLIDAEGGTLFVAQPRLVPGRLFTRAHVSTVTDTTSEKLVESLMAPWLTGDAGISCEALDASWTATLDREGHAVLDQVLSALEGRDTPIPALVPDADMPDPDQSLPAWQATSLSEVVRRLAAFGISSSVAPGLAQLGLPQRRLDLSAGRLGDLPRRLAQAGIQARFVQGVLCLAIMTDTIEDRRHPAQRRRLALLPVHHLIRDAGEGLLLATTLHDRVAPWWWSRPGALLRFHEARRSLLVAADLPTIHALLGALAVVDRHGLDAGLTHLDRSDP